MKDFIVKMIAVLGAGIVIIALAGCGADSASSNKAATFAKEQVKQIYIKTDGQHIKVLPSSESQVKVSMNSDKELPAVLKGGSLTVDIEPPSGIINLKTDTLYVEVPPENYQTISFTTTSGNISVVDVKAKELNLTADSGSITINGFKGNVDAATESGKIKSSLVSASDITSEGAGETLLTTIGVKEEAAAKLKIRSSSGNITLH